MTTQAQLRRLAQPWLTPELVARGFSLGPNRLEYQRKVGPVFHFLTAQVLRGGDDMCLWTFPWMPEGQAPYDMNEFPRGIGVYAGGRLGQNSVGIGGKSWPIATEADVHASYRDMLQVLDKVAIPFLDRIVTREALAAAVSPGERFAAGGILRADLILGKVAVPLALANPSS